MAASRALTDLPTWLCNSARVRPASHPAAPTEHPLSLIHCLCLSIKCRGERNTLQCPTPFICLPCVLRQNSSPAHKTSCIAGTALTHPCVLQTQEQDIARTH
jgi:hypothetical protein